jgi:hypothetical protein
MFAQVGERFPWRVFDEITQWNLRPRGPKYFLACPLVFGYIFAKSAVC